MGRRTISLLLIALSFALSAQEKYKVPRPLRAEGWPAHVHLRWDGRNGFVYNIFRYTPEMLLPDGTFSSTPEFCATVSSGEYLDFGIGSSESPRSFVYIVCPDGISPDSPAAAEFSVRADVPAASDELLLDMIQRYTTAYFTDFAQASTGMARERSNDVHGDIVTTGGTGFGIMAVIAGAGRGYHSEEKAVETIEKIVSFLETAERFHGAWAHWYDSDTGKPFSFSRYDDGGDIVETAFLAAGLLTARQWLSGNGNDGLARRCDALWRGIEWSWYTKGEDETLYWHWSKNFGWKMNHRIKGFDETLITYILAASSPTWPIDRKVYESGYKTSPYYWNKESYYNLPIYIGMAYGGPLFFTHYSFLGLNPHGLKDASTDYFTRNRNHVLIHRLYAIDNPGGFAGYGENLWGFTSSDDPLAGYTSHHPMTRDDNGTVSPTAAVSSIVYAPEEVMEVIRHFYYDLGEELFGRYGFYDAYNPSMCEGQRVVRSYLAIDQGPQAVMIENYRSGLIWKLFMSCPEIAAGLEKLGFTTINY